MVHPQLIQCIPNFSDGRDLSKLAQLRRSIVASGVRLADWSADPDHNRSVFTFVGSPEQIEVASIVAAATAIELFDITKHAGVHPRIGVLDVLPFVPILNVTMDECVALALKVGQHLSTRWGLPVFLYDHASPRGETLPSIRKRAFKSIDPDFGPSQPHATAGAVAIGAREPLIAFNVNLVGGSLLLARKIAGEVREAYPNQVRALGLELPSRRIFQVSMNIIRPDIVDLYQLTCFVQSRCSVLESELIGVMPGFAAHAALKTSLKLAELNPSQVLLETWPGIDDSPKE